MAPHKLHLGPGHLAKKHSLGQLGPFPQVPLRGWETLTVGLREWGPCVLVT